MVSLFKLKYVKSLQELIRFKPIILVKYEFSVLEPWIRGAKSNFTSFCSNLTLTSDIAFTILSQSIGNLAFCFTTERAANSLIDFKFERVHI